MSSMHSSAQVSPVSAVVPAEVLRLEQLLGKIFNDEIEKALTEETAADSTGSAKPVNNLPESATLNHLLDFSPRGLHALPRGKAYLQHPKESARTISL